MKFGATEAHSGRKRNTRKIKWNPEPLGLNEKIPGHATGKIHNTFKFIKPKFIALPKELKKALTPALSIKKNPRLEHLFFGHPSSQF